MTGVQTCALPIYRRTVFVPTENAGKQVFIYFKGANQETELFVNGKSAGIHLGGYTRFCFDITNLIEVGKQNKFAIKVNNRFNENIPPLTADFNFYGGVYRDVFLIYTEKQHISTTHFASSGVYITTPKVSEKEAQVTIKTIVSNDDNKPVNLTVENTIVSNKGLISIKKSTSLKLASGSSQTLEQKEIKVEQPMLWSSDSPTLYTVITRIIDAKTNKLLDEVTNPLGFRWYEFTSDKGFFLNGKPLKLIGTCRHQCFLGMGNAIPDEIHVRDVKLLKNMGANFLRVSHYPQDPTVLEMCDKLGIITSVEIPLDNEITENKEFTDNSLTMAKEMVMQDFNRPSIVIWAYMNEVLLKLPFKQDSIRNAQYYNSVRRLATQIDNQIKKDDPARYTMIPCHGYFEPYQKAGLYEIPQIVGLNLYFGWYVGVFSDFDAYLDNAKKMIPNKPFLMTEYGADVDPRLHSFNPQRFDYTAEYANLFHEYYIKTILQRPNIAGATIWNLNDFYVEERSNAVPHVNNKGIVTLDRELKDTYLQYQALLSKTPIITIGGMNWKIRGGNTDKNNVCFQPVKVYSNQKSVELTINGKSLGIKQVVDNIAQFDVPFLGGINTLDATTTSENGIIRNQLKVDFRAIPADLSTFSEINVMMGSKRYFEDKKESVCWIPEKEYQPGSWGFVGGWP